MVREVVRFFSTVGIAAVVGHAAASIYETGEVKPEDISVGDGVEAVKSDRVYSPYVGRDYPDQVLFGDAHLHTNLSPDAGLLGTTLDVEAALFTGSNDASASLSGGTTHGNRGHRCDPRRRAGASVERSGSRDGHGPSSCG